MHKFFLKKRNRPNAGDKAHFFSSLKKLRFQKLKYIPKVLSKFEKRLILALFLIIFGSCIWLVITLYPRHIHIEPADGGIYIEGLVEEPQYINPILAPVSDSDLDITKLVFSGLMRYNEKQELVPDLAKSFEVSEDQKNYIFHLKQGVKWHDGKDFTADDVIFTVQSIKNPEYQSPLYANFQGVAVEKLDDFTVKFTLVETLFSPFLAENTVFGILPQHIWKEIPPKNVFLAEFNLKPIGTGPFRFKEYKKDKRTGTIKSYTLEAFDNYFGKKPYLEKIVFKFYKNYPDLIWAYNKKEIKGISYVLPQEKSNIKKEINYFLLKLPRYYALFFNQPQNPALQQKEVRKALAFGLDRQKIIDEALAGEGIIIDSPILPNFLGYNSEVQKYDYNPEKAKELLDQAGWIKSEDKNVRTKNGKELVISITYAEQPEFAKVALIISKCWEKIGIKVNLEGINPSVLQSERIRPRAYEVLLYGELITHDPDPYPFWHSSQREDPGLNLTSFKNKSVDDLLETARKTTEKEKRKLKYLHFQNIIAEELPAIFLYSPTYLFGVSNQIKGIELEYITTPSDRFADIVNWYIKIKRQWK